MHADLLFFGLLSVFCAFSELVFPFKRIIKRNTALADEMEFNIKKAINGYTEINDNNRQDIYDELRNSYDAMKSKLNATSDWMD